MAAFVRFNWITRRKWETPVDSTEGKLRRACVCVLEVVRLPYRSGKVCGRQHRRETQKRGVVKAKERNLITYLTSAACIIRLIRKLRFAGSV